MANILLVLTHPNPDSLNAATAKSIQQALEKDGHTVRFKDLYRADFDPVLDMKDFQEWGKGSVPAAVKKEQEDMTWADGLAFVHPIWWNAMPAELKGWLDRTLTKGYAWDFNEQGLDGKLAGKKAFVATTMGSPEQLYDGLNISMDKINDHLRKGTLNFCGIREVKFVETFGVLMDESAPERHIKDATEGAVAFFKA